MKKSKLFGSKLIENIKYPRIPNVIILSPYESLYDKQFEDGDLLDANSIKKYVKYLTGLENMVSFSDLATNIKPGIVQIGDNISINNGLINIERISDDFIKQLQNG